MGEGITPANEEELLDKELLERDELVSAIELLERDELVSAIELLEREELVLVIAIELLDLDELLGVGAATVIVIDVVSVLQFVAQSRHPLTK